jgi:hypothetical protein
MRIYLQDKKALDALTDLGTQYGNVYGKPIVNPITLSGFHGVEITDTEGLILFMLDRIKCYEGLIERTPLN